MNSPPHGAPASPAAVGQENATFGIGPAKNGQLDNRAVYRYIAGPGATLTDTVLVTNLQTRSVTLDVYPIDVTSTATGALDYHPKASARTGLAMWVTIVTPNGKGSVTLPARSSALLPLQLRVPRNAEPGDHIAAVMASVTGAIVDPNKQQLSFEQRVGVQVDLRVSGPARAALAIEQLRTRFRGPLNPLGTGTAIVSYRVHNVGNLDLSAHQAVRISGFLGTTGRVAPIADVPVLLPDSVVPVTVTIRGVWPEFGMTTRVTLTPALSATEASTYRVAPVVATKSMLAVPWAFLVAVSTAIVIITALVALERRRRRDARAPRHGNGGGRRALVGAR